MTSKKKKTENEVNKSDPLAKQILDKYGTEVLMQDSVYTKDGKAGVNASASQSYMPDKFSENVVLWKAPNNWIRIEFDGVDANTVKALVSETESNLKALEIDYCITFHKGGVSPYINICNLKKMPLNEQNRDAKLLFLDIILSSKAKKFLDKGNLSFTWTPVIGNPHWKPKYQGAVHEIVKGTSPLEQENNYPEHLLKDLKKSKKTSKKVKIDLMRDGKWVEDFLLNYCCNNELPEGDRHNVINKNLAILVANRDDQEEIISKYHSCNAGAGSVHGWIVNFHRGIIKDISPGELRKYIQDNEIPYDIFEDKTLIVHIPKKYHLEDNDVPLYIDHALGLIEINNTVHRYYGAWIYSSEEKKDKIIKKHTPIIVLDNQTITDDADPQNFFVGYDSVIGVKNDRFSRKGIKRFAKGSTVKPKEVFELFKSKFESSMVYEREEWYSLLPIWCMTTYYQDLVNKSLIIKVEGRSGTAKSKTGRIICNLSFNGKKFLCPTPANFFRYRANNKATLFIEEAERLFDDSKKGGADSELVEYLNGSYEKGNTVPRQNDKDLSKTDEFDPYGFTCIGSIKPLKGALEKRSITLTQIKAKKGDTRSEVEIEADDPRFAKARDDMYICGLTHWKQYRDIYNSLERSYGLENREWLVSKPLIAMAYLIDPELAPKIGKFLQHLFYVRDESITSESIEYSVIEYLIQKTANDSDGVFISNQDIKECILKQNEYAKVNQKTVGTTMQQLGFKEYKSIDSYGKNRGYSLIFWKVADIAIRNEYLTPEEIVNNLSDLSDLSEKSIKPSDFEEWASDKYSYKSSDKSNLLTNLTDKQIKQGNNIDFKLFFEKESTVSKETLVNFCGSIDAVELALKQGLISEIRPDIYQMVK